MYGIKNETPAQYNARQARCRQLARTMTAEQAYSIATSVQTVMDLEFGSAEHDRYVAANMVLRGQA